MAIWELLLIAVGLSMDAFAVAMCKGLGMRSLSYRNIFLTGAFFGGFQALMPAAGYLLGTQFASVVTPVDHWIAFGLLCFIGGKMIYESRHACEGEACSTDPDKNGFSVKALLVSAVATSIDALAVGISFAFLNVRIVPASLLIGCVTFLLSCLGVRLGHVIRGNLQSKADIAGGAVLILMGVKILLEHLGVIGF